MKSMFRVLLVAAAIALTGCAASVNRPDGGVGTMTLTPRAAQKIVLTVQGSPQASASSDWETLRAQWRESMGVAAKAAGLGFSYVDSGLPGGQDAATHVKVIVSDYRYVSAGARFGLGVFTGNAFVVAQTEFLELPGHKLIGTRAYDTTSSAWQGVFAPMTGKQIDAICTEIVKEVAQSRVAGR